MMCVDVFDVCVVVEAMCDDCVVIGIGVVHVHVVVVNVVEDAVVVDDDVVRVSDVGMCDVVLLFMMLFMI